MPASARSPSLGPGCVPPIQPGPGDGRPVNTEVEIAAEDATDQEALQAQMAEIFGVQDLWTVDEFVNPTAENIVDQDEDTVGFSRGDITILVNN